MPTTASGERPDRSLEMIDFGTDACFAPNTDSWFDIHSTILLSIVDVPAISLSYRDRLIIHDEPSRERHRDQRPFMSINGPSVIQKVAQKIQLVTVYTQ
jgi:hypothetical protein